MGIFLKSNAQQKEIEITYISNSGFLIETAGKQVIIDVLFRNGFGQYLVPTSTIVENIINQDAPFNKANLMLVTHNHGDHFTSVLRWVIE